MFASLTQYLLVHLMSIYLFKLHLQYVKRTVTMVMSLSTALVYVLMDMTVLSAIDLLSVLQIAAVEVFASKTIHVLVTQDLM